MEILFICLVVAVAVWLISALLKPEKSKKTPTPPTEDVYILGCNGDCGYFTPHFAKNSHGEYDMVKGMAYCAYLGKTKKMGSQCPYAKDHPDRLGKSVFSVD